MDSSGLTAVVTLEVSFEIVVLSEPLPTHLAREPVLAVVRTVEELVVPQLVFPSESLATGGTLVGRLTRVGHLVVPEQLQPVVLDGAVSTLVPMKVQVLLHHMSL